MIDLDLNPRPKVIVMHPCDGCKFIGNSTYFFGRMPLCRLTNRRQYPYSLNDGIVMECHTRGDKS